MAIEKKEEPVHVWILYLLGITIAAFVFFLLIFSVGLWITV